jgi:hypothetical protein
VNVPSRSALFTSGGAVERLRPLLKVSLFYQTALSLKIGGTASVARRVKWSTGLPHFAGSRHVQLVAPVNGNVAV